MDHVRPEALQLPPHPGHGPAGHPHGGVAGERNGGQPVHRHPVEVLDDLLRRAPERRGFVGGRHDHDVVPAGDQLLDDPQHRVGDSVEVGEELLGDHGDSHAPEPAVAGRPDGERGVARR